MIIQKRNIYLNCDLQKLQNLQISLTILIVFIFSVIQIGTNCKTYTTNNYIISGQEPKTGKFLCQTSHKDHNGHNGFCNDSCVSRQFISTEAICVIGKRKNDVYAVVGNIKNAEGGRIR